MAYFVLGSIGMCDSNIGGKFGLSLEGEQVMRFVDLNEFGSFEHKDSV